MPPIAQFSLCPFHVLFQFSVPLYPLPSLPIIPVSPPHRPPTCTVQALSACRALPGDTFSDGEVPTSTFFHGAVKQLEEWWQSSAPWPCWWAQGSSAMLRACYSLPWGGVRAMCWSQNSRMLLGFYEISGIFQKSSWNLPSLLLAHTEALVWLCLLSPTSFQSPGSVPQECLRRQLAALHWFLSSPGLWSHISRGMQTHSDVTLPYPALSKHNAHRKVSESPPLIFPHWKLWVTEAKELTASASTPCTMPWFFLELYFRLFSYTLPTSCILLRSFSSSFQRYGCPGYRW